jgi:DNA-binding NarL/FixJ family response regulator
MFQLHGLLSIGYGEYSPMERRVTEPIKVLIVSDNMIRIGIRMILDTQPNISIVGEASSSPNAIEIAARQKPDINLIDLDLFGTHVSNLIHELRKAAEHALPLILISLGNYEESIWKALTSAAGMVLKVQPPAVLIAAIESLCEREPRFDPAKMQSLRMQSNNTHMPNKFNQETEKINSLTTRERDIIHLVAKGLPNKDIADRLCIGEVTVRHHLTNIFGKLEVSNRQQLLILAHHYQLAELTLGLEVTNR